MSEKAKLKHIAKIAADMAKRLTELTTKAAEQGVYLESLQATIYQAGFIEGLCYVPDDIDNSDDE